MQTTEKSVKTISLQEPHSKQAVKASKPPVMGVKYQTTSANKSNKDQFDQSASFLSNFKKHNADKSDQPKADEVNLGKSIRNSFEKL